MVIWALPEPTADRPLSVKYLLYCGRDGGCVVRYDKESGEGHHRPFFEDLERCRDGTSDVMLLRASCPSALRGSLRLFKIAPGEFVESLDQLIADFRHDCTDWQAGGGNESDRNRGA